MKGPKKVKTVMSLPEETVDKIDLLASFQKVHTSEIVNRLICDHLSQIPSTHPLSQALQALSQAS